MTEISVGIPTMNNKKTIRETLESLLQQTRPPDRIIVVDASDDRTPNIIREIADESDIPIDYYRQSEKGRGVGRARQDIYKNFEEDILACLDTDHRVGREWIAKRVEFHEKNPEYGVLSGTDIPGMDEEVMSPKSPHYFRQANCSLTASTLEAVNGWDPWMPRGEDWDMHIRLWRADIQSYVRGDLSTEKLGQQGWRSIFRKNLRRPSAIQFFRKYGIWYFKFHPLHPLGEVASLASAIGLFLGISLAILGSPLTLLLLVVPIFGSGGFLYFRLLRNRNGFYLNKDDAVWILTFLTLWVSAFRELHYGKNHRWNYGGI